MLLQQYFSSKILFTFLIVAITASISAQYSSQTVIDSFQTLINKEQDDELKASLYKSAIDHPSIKIEDDIKKVFKKATKQFFKKEDKTHFLNLSIDFASKLALIGELESSKKAYQEIIGQTFIKEYLDHYGRALNGISRISHQRGGGRQSLNYALESINALRESNFYNSLCQSYVEASIFYRNQGILDSAMMYVDTAIIVGRQIEKNKQQLSSAFSTKGRLYRMTGDNESAKENYLEAETVALEENNEKSLAVIYNNLGNIGHISGNYETALTYYLKSLNIKEKENNQKGISIAYHNIGAIKYDMKDWDNAKKEFSKSLQIANQLDYKNLKIHNYLKLGNISYEQLNYDTSLTYFKNAESIADSINFATGLISSKLGLGKSLLKLNNFEDASVYLLDGLSLAEKTTQKHYESSLLVHLAELYRKVKNSKEYEDTKDVNLTDKQIETLLLRAKNLADEMNNAENKIEALEGLHLFYSSKKNYLNDANVLSQLVVLKDSLFSKERTESMTEWETKYETSEKEKQIVKLEAEKEIEAVKRKSLYSLLFGVVLFFSTLLFTGYNFIKLRNKKRQANQRELFRSKLSSDLHDDVGSLLTGLAMQSELAANFVDDKMKPTLNKIQEMSRDAMSRMRDTVWAIDSRKDTYHDLIDRMRDFGEDILNPTNFQFSLLVNIRNKNERISPELRQNLYMIFKEALTNVAKYSNGDKVVVRLSEEKNNLNLKIQDNGIVVEKDIKTSGIGISSMKQRAQDLGGILEISFNKKGYFVEANIPT